MLVIYSLFDWFLEHRMLIICRAVCTQMRELARCHRLYISVQWFASLLAHASRMSTQPASEARQKKNSSDGRYREVLAEGGKWRKENTAEILEATNCNAHVRSRIQQSTGLYGPRCPCE